MYADSDPDVIPRPNYSSEQSRQAPVDDDDDFDPEYDWDGRSKPLMSQFNTVPEYDDARGQWEAAQASQAAQQQFEQTQNVAELAALGLDPSGNYDGDFLSWIEIRKQSEKAAAENDSWTTAHRDAKQRIKEYTTMINDKVAGYKDMVEKQAKSDARSRIKKDSIDFIVAAARGDLDHDLPIIQKAINAHNRLEGSSNKPDQFFVARVGRQDAHTFKNCGPGHLLFIEFPMVADHAKDAAERNEDLISYSLRVGGKLRKLDRKTGKLVEVIEYM